MNIKTVGKAVVVTTNIKFADLGNFKDAAVVKDDKGHEVYRISTGSEASVKNFGATFTNAGADGNAELTLTVSNSVADVAEYVRKNLGEALIALGTFETIVADTILAKKAALEAIEIVEA